MSNPRNRTAVCNAGALFSEEQYRLWLWLVAWFFCPLHQFILQSLWPLNVPSCIPQNIVAAVTLGWISLLIESQKHVFFLLILFWSLLTVLVCICVCFHQKWSYVPSIYHGHIEPFFYKKKYARICLLSMCWCSLPDCIGPVQEETNIIPVLFLCSILFTHFCINNRCSDLFCSI